MNAPDLSRAVAIHSQVPALEVGQHVRGAIGERTREGVVIHANARHFVVQWRDGVRNTCQQGWDYADSLQPVEAEEAAR